MTKQDLIRKLTSRKLWAMIVGFITPLLVAFNVPDLTIEQIAAIITATGSLVAYIIGEGLVDAARVAKPAEANNAQYAPYSAPKSERSGL